MILEIAQLQIKPGQTAAFEAAFAQAQAIIASMPGYLGYELPPKTLKVGDECDTIASQVKEFCHVHHHLAS